jgi:hypothetical protein
LGDCRLGQGSTQIKPWWPPNFTIERCSIVTCRSECAGSLENKGLRL